MKQLPYFEVAGTYEDVGRMIGKRFGEQIRLSISKNQTSVRTYKNLLDKSREYLLLTDKYFPNLMVELRATAQAANVDPLEYFFCNNREVYDQMGGQDKKEAADHCTVVVGQNDDDVVVGHNEDWSLDAIDSLYVLKATVNGITFIGLNYCTVVAGLAASMNSFGLVQCINDLHAGNQIGVPKNFFARAILECKTLDEAENLIRAVPQASGFNHVLVQNGEIRNIEIAGEHIATEIIKNRPYVHTNHYLNNELQQYEEFHTRSSEARYLRAVGMAHENMTKADVIAILSDTQNEEYPICRADETIGSAVFTSKHREAFFCYGHPCKGEYIKYEI